MLSAVFCLLGMDPEQRGPGAEDQEEREVEQMPDQKNTVVTDTGLEIYTDDMYIYADEYIASLHDPDSIYSSAGNTFTGMIKYINRHMGFNESMYADIELLNNECSTTH